MTLFYQVAYYIALPFICLAFPHKVIGRENLPEGGALLCPNHPSAWDPILIAMCLPARSRLVFMAKDSLFRNPVLARILTWLGAFPVRRGKSDLAAVKTALRSLEEGKRLILFPEGTRSEYQGENEAKGGAAFMSIRTGVPIVPVYCGERHRLFRKTTVIFGEPYYPAIAGRRPTPEENRQVSEDLVKRIYALREREGGK